MTAHLRQIVAAGGEFGIDQRGAESGIPANLTLFIGIENPLSFKLENSGKYVGTVYAPYIPIKIENSGEFWGAAIAKNITLENSAKVHYDEQLGLGPWSGRFRVASWREVLQ